MTKLQCVAPENIHTPPNRRDWKFLDGGGGEGSQRPKDFSKCMELDWNFHRGGGSKKNPFRGGGMDTFWNHTMYHQAYIKWTYSHV